MFYKDVGDLTTQIVVALIQAGKVSSLEELTQYYECVSKLISCADSEARNFVNEE